MLTSTLSDQERKECMSKFERFVCTACPWLFGAVCIVAGLIVAARHKPEESMIWVVMICSGFVLMTLYGIITVQLQILKSLEQQKKESSSGES
jgi:hypothetical protein